MSSSSCLPTSKWSTFQQVCMFARSFDILMGSELWGMRGTLIQKLHKGDRVVSPVDGKIVFNEVIITVHA